MRKNQKIGPRKCERIREWRKRGKTHREIAEKFDVSVDRAAQHAYGNCTCETDVAPAVSRFTPDEETCQQWRRRANGGEQYSAIAEDTEYTYPTVRTHCVGDCSHEHDVEPVDENRGPGKVSAEICWHMTYLYAIEQMPPDDIMQVIELEYGVELDRATSVTYHATGQCQHELPDE